MKFSIRDLMWLTVVVALAVGWWVEHRRMSAELDLVGLQNTQLKSDIVDLKREVLRMELIRESKRLSGIDPFSSVKMWADTPTKNDRTDPISAVSTGMFRNSQVIVVHHGPTPSPILPKP